MDTGTKRYLLSIISGAIIYLGGKIHTRWSTFLKQYQGRIAETHHMDYLPELRKDTREAELSA